MQSNKKIFISKLSIPGKSNDELSYVFSDTLTVSGNDSPALFGIFYLQSSDDVYHVIIKETVKHYLDFFHRTPKNLTQSLKEGEFDSAEFIFENAIQYTNEQVTQALLEAQESSQRSFDFKKVHFVLGALFGDALFLNITGSLIHPIYIYPVFRKEGFSHYSLINIAEGKEGSDSQSRLFSQVVSGKLSIQGSTLVVCNQPFVEYVSVNQVKYAATNMPIQQLAPYFQGLLGKINTRNDFSALFINPYYTGPAVQPEAHVQTASNASMAELNSTAQGTTSIMAQNIGSHLGKFTAATVSLGLLISKKIVPLLGKLLHFVRSLADSIRKQGFSLKKMESAAHSFKPQQFLEEKKYVFRKLFSELKAFIRKDTRDQVRDKLRLSIKQATEYAKQRVKQKISSLSLISRVLISLSVLFIFLFLSSIVSLQAKQKTERKVAAFQEQVRVIQLKSDLAEASLIYENEDKARLILNEAQELLITLPQVTQQEQAEFKRLEERVKGIRAKTDHITLIANPTVVAQLESQIPSLSSLTLERVGDTVLVVAPESVYALNTANGTATLIDTQAKLPSIHCSGSLSDTKAYFCIGDGNRLGILDVKEKTVSTVGVSFADKQQSITAIKMYNKRLYVLDSRSGTIYRHAKKGDSFEEGVRWIQDGTPIKDALGFAIDGTIYVLADGSSVQKFASGKAEPFSISVSPPVSGMTKLLTSDEIPNLYILEPSQKRILVIDKKSKKVTDHITSDSFSDLKDFVLTKKNILILNGSTVYKIPQ